LSATCACIAAIEEACPARFTLVNFEMRSVSQHEIVNQGDLFGHSVLLSRDINECTYSKDPTFDLSSYLLRRRSTAEGSVFAARPEQSRIDSLGQSKNYAHGISGGIGASGCAI
jgi:hypothetical protein